MDVKFQFTGTDNGEMNYVIEEVRNGKTVGRRNYYVYVIAALYDGNGSVHTGE